MRKEVQFKAVSAFIFFAGVLFGFNDASIHPQYMRFQDGRHPSSEDHQYHSKAIFTGMPSYMGRNGMASSPLDSRGHSYEINGMHTPREANAVHRAGEVNEVHSAGEVNGVPYYIRLNTYGPAESATSFTVQPSYGRNSDDALHHAEMPQSPYYARNPAVIYFTRNPNAPCLAGRSPKVSPVNRALNFRAADESEPSGETEQLVPRILLRHLFPSVPKEKRYHYARRTKDSGYGPHNKRFSRLARMYRFWHSLYESSKDNSRVHHDKITKSPNKNKPQHTPTPHHTTQHTKENEVDQPYVSPSIITPPEDNEQLHTPSQPYPDGYSGPYGGTSASPYPPEDDEQLHTPSQPYPDGYSGPYGGTSASPYPPEVPPESVYLHYPPLSSFPDDPESPYPHYPPLSPFPDDPEPPHTHFPSSPFYNEEQPPPDYPQYPPSPFHTEEQSPPDYPQYPSSPFYTEDQSPPDYPQYPSSPFHTEEQSPPDYPQYPSSPFYIEEQSPPAYLQYPPSPYYPGDPSSSYPQYPPSLYYPENQPHTHHTHLPSPHYPEDERPHFFRKNPSSPDSAEEQPPQSFRQNPSLSDSTEEQPPHSFRQYPPWPYIADQRETPSFPQYPSSSFYSDDLGFPPFPMFPFFIDDLGFPFFPPFPYFSDMQDPSSLSRPQSSPYFAGSFASSQYPTSILYTTTSLPSSNNRKTKSRVIASTLPDTEIVFTKTLSPDSEDHTLADELQLPCMANKHSRKLTDKSKTPQRSWGTSDNHMILLRDEEDDSLADDNTKNSAVRTVLTIVEKLAKHIFQQLMTSSED